MSEANKQPQTLDELNKWLAINGMDRALALLKMAEKGEVGLAHAVDPEHGTVFLVAMVTTTLLGSMPEHLKVEVPAGLPADVTIPLPVAQVLTAIQSKQVSEVGATGRLLLFDAGIAKRDDSSHEQAQASGQ